MTQWLEQGVEALLFDLDGTLVDTVPDLCTASNAMLDAFNLPRVSVDFVRLRIGHGIPALIGEILSAAAVTETSALARGQKIFERCYADCCCDYSVLYPGVDSTLELLSTRGFRLACVTNKASRFAERILRSLGLTSKLAFILGGDKVKRKKPASDALLMASQWLGVSVQRCIMVGDSRNDIEAAQRLSMPVIYVTYGYNRGEDLAPMVQANALPGQVIGSIQELPKLLPPTGGSRACN